MTKPRIIIYRESVTDLATDIAFELTQEQGEELIKELRRLIDSYPKKFCAGEFINDVRG